MSRNNCCYLRDRRYAAHTRHIYLGCVAHFTRWLATEGLGLEEADEKPAGALSARTCRAATARRLSGASRMRSGPPCCTCTGCLGAAARSRHRRPTTSGLIASELAAFDRYMGTVRGLAASTRRQRVRIVGAFLTERFGDGPLALAELTTAELSCFLCWAAAMAGGGLREPSR